MNKIKRFLLLVASLVGAVAPALADPITMLDGFSVSSGKVGLTSDKIELRSSGSTGKATVKYVDSSANSRTYTWPDAGADASPVMTAGAQTIAGVKTFSSAPVITGGLTAANIQTGSAKRQVLVATLSPITGAAADATVYRATLFPGRAGTVTRVTLGCQTAPSVGVDTIKVLKGSSSGNTMLNAATFDANTLVANTATNATLTSTSADLGVTATQPIYCEYSAGTQTVDAIGISAVIEFEPTDF
jgi:hypothetical protein